jgi:hypothetical protein
MTFQLILEVEHFKIAKDVWNITKSKKIIAFMEGWYKNNSKMIKSSDNKLMKGCSFAVPWTEEIKKILIRFFIIDSLLSIEIGLSTYIIDVEDLDLKTTRRQLKLNIMPKAGVEPIGNLYCIISIQSLFEDEQRSLQQQQYVENESSHCQLSLPPDFRFKKLSKIINWEKLRSFPFDKYRVNRFLLFYCFY